MFCKEFIPFGRPNFSDQEIQAVTKTLKSGWVGMGKETIAFEKELAQFLNAPHVVTVNSCTSALFLALLVHGIKEGDEVICPSLTWCSTANAALYLGAKPVFCDVDPETFCVTASTILSKITEKTRAVIIVHYGGWAIDVHALKVALPAHIPIIEDGAHAFGTKYPDGSPVGSSGNLTCFSFYANKNLSTGEGGALSLANTELAEKLQMFRQHCMNQNAWKRFIQSQVVTQPPLEQLGYKMNYTDLQASIGRIQLKRQEEFRITRLKIAEEYTKGLKELSHAVILPRNILHPHHARHLYPLLFRENNDSMNRDLFLREMRARNIGASIHYALLHLMPLYGDIAEQPCLPSSEYIGRSIASLPISASMTTEDAKYIIKQIHEVINAGIPKQNATCKQKNKSVLSGKHTEQAKMALKYGFYGRLNAHFPSQIIVDVTERCNLACIHCPHSQRHNFTKSNNHLLDPKLNEKLVDEVKKDGQGATQYIRYTANGEPLTHPDIFEMLEYAIKNSGVLTTLTTNGTLLTPEKIEKLLMTGVDLIDISIDAFTAETYAKIRVHGHYETTRTNVLNLIEMNNKSPNTIKIVVSFVEQDLNTHESLNFKSYWQDKGVYEVIIRRLHSNAGANVNISNEESKKIFTTKRYPCLYPWERISLNAKGNLGFCPVDWVNGGVVADFRKTSIRETWQGAFYQNLREAHLSNDFTKHCFCAQCQDWQQTRWPHEGRSYADLITKITHETIKKAYNNLHKND